MADDNVTDLNEKKDGGGKGGGGAKTASQLLKEISQQLSSKKSGEWKQKLEKQVVEIATLKKSLALAEAKLEEMCREADADIKG